MAKVMFLCTGPSECKYAELDVLGYCRDEGDEGHLTVCNACKEAQLEALEKAIKEVNSE